VGALADENGVFTLEKTEVGTVDVTVSALGFSPVTKRIILTEGTVHTLDVTMFASGETMEEVVVTGTMKAVSRSTSPVPVEVFSADFFRANPTPSVFESLQNVNGVRPQLNCSVCNTGDIHINGLEGPYTMVLIDGMPIVSGLSTVYGLTGIPQSLIARTEVVKGPASTLYGSEAVGGLINVITKDPGSAPTFSADVMASGWGELNADLGFKATVGGKAHSLLGVNYFRYQNPIDNNNERVMFQFSANGHDQNSVYGETIYNATQYVGFGQLTWNKELFGSHDLLLGASYRYTWYDDNTPVTAGFGDDVGINQPSVVHLPGVFLQDEIRLNHQNVLLLGARYDYTPRHGNILTPRLNYKWNSKSMKDVVRLSVGSGYRVANVFTEDHAALSGAREVIFEDELLPETSWNANVNYTKRIFTAGGTVVNLDGSAFYTFFNNRILPDYETNPNAIIYANLDGSAVSQGFSISSDVSFSKGASLNLGLTVQDVYTEENGVRERQLLTESVSGVWRLSIPLLRYQMKFDYTGNIYGPMDLPLLGELDDRPAQSPWFSTQNLQLTKTFLNGMEIYGGVKNLLNYTPPANSIARAFDPFDRGVSFGPDGQAIATPDNPQALTFDPTYVYASNQGRRFFIGWRWALE